MLYQADLDYQIDFTLSMPSPAFSRDVSGVSDTCDTAEECDQTEAHSQIDLAAALEKLVDDLADIHLSLKDLPEASSSSSSTFEMNSNEKVICMFSE